MNTQLTSEQILARHKIASADVNPGFSHHIVIKTGTHEFSVHFYYTHPDEQPHEYRMIRKSFNGREWSLK